MKSAGIERPIAFEVVRNGRRMCVAGLRGRPGVLTAIFHAKGVAEMEVDVGGLDSTTQEHLTWWKQALRIGDEVTIRVLEGTKTTRVRSRTNLGEDFVAKGEKAYLRKAAKKYGYKLVRA